jgi:uncharacterized lipoprotein YmbA
MKKLLSIIFIVALAGCASTSPSTVKQFPTAATSLMQPCPDLTQVDPATTKLSDVLVVVTTNYSEYYECKVKVDNWIEWYNTQKTINDNVK